MSELSLVLQNLHVQIVMESTHGSQGTIELILGPMFSGKSAELARRVRSFVAAGLKALLVSFKGDVRQEATSQVDKHKVRARAVASLHEVENEAWAYSVIAIDEGQFLPDLPKYTEKWANEGKIILVAALDSTFARQPFESIQRLLPLAEEVVKLKATCFSCQKEASFTFRTSKEIDVQLVGGADKYEARCRSCHAAGEAQKAAEVGPSDQTKRRKSNRLSAGSSRRQSLETLADSTNMQSVHSSLQTLCLR